MLVQVRVLSLSRTDEIVATAAALALLVPLAWRSRRPLLLLGTFAVVGIVGQWLPKRVTDIEAFGLIVLLVLYSVAAHTRGWHALLSAGFTVAFGTAVVLDDPDGVSLSGVLFFILLFGAPWLAGKVVQRRRTGEARMRQERDAAEAAIVEERSRIARELHDIVAHAISVTVLQARGGRRMLETHPAEARAAFDAIERTSTQALAEMRRLLGMLREGGAIGLAPQPSLSHLDALVESVRQAGLPIEIVREGDPIELPPGVDLSAYRIVQEALTNALKHAGPARARIRIRYSADEIEIEIEDDGQGSPSEHGGGHGLAGIRERVAIFGGDLDAGPRPTGGYSLRARLPIASVRA